MTPLLASVDVNTESVMLTVLMQLVVIILAARVFAALFRRLGQPTVVGEIVAGLVLGPSLLGKWFPEVSARIFDPAVAPAFNVLSQLGLVFLLFFIGLEFDFSHLKKHGRSAMAVSLIGILLPFTSGWLLARWMHGPLGHEANDQGFALFMGTAMSITAIPILGRMMMELNIARTRLGAVTITAAAFDDAAGWIILAAVSAIVRAEFQVSASVRMIAETIGFALLMVFVARPLLRRAIRYALRRGDGELGLAGLAALIIVLFLCSIATNLIGIFSIFGAFLLGAILSDEHEFRQVVARQLRNFVTAFFLPIFFTYTGLRTDIGTLESPTLWLLAAVVLGVAIAGKFGGCMLAAWAGGFSVREATCIGVMMNTRALMELIVINVGYDLGVIPNTVFCMLVMMALVTTIMTTPILMAVMKGTELEPHIERSIFRTHRRAALQAIDCGTEH